MLYTSPTQKKIIKSISEVQADFILIYYNNKRTIISFLEASSLNRLKSSPQLQAGFCGAPVHRAVQGWPAGTAQGQGRAELVSGFREADVPPNEPCAPCSPVRYPGLIRSHGVLVLKKPDNLKTSIISLCVAFFYFVRKRQDNLPLGLYHKRQSKSLLLVYWDFTWCVHLNRSLLCRPVKLTHVLRCVFTMDLEIRDMLYILSLSQNNGLYVSGAKQERGSGPF